MVSPKKAKKKSLLRVLVLIIAVVIVIVASLLVQSWWNSRPGPDPREISLTARVGDREIEVPTYLACEVGAECPEGEIPRIEVGAGENLVIEVPESVHQGQWNVLSIYDDPAANDQVLHGSYEAESAEIPGSVDPVAEDGTERPQLVVVEIAAVLIGEDDNGEETPYSVVWSVNTTNQDEASPAAAE